MRPFHYLIAFSILGSDPGPGAEGLAARPGDAVAVRLTDGRLVRGIVDSRSGVDELWLTIDRPHVRMTSVFRTEDLLEVLPVTSRRGAAADRSPSSERLRPEVYPGRRAAMLQVFSRTADWDADAGADGLELVMRPLDPAGRLTPVRGTIEADLFGFTTASRTPDRIESWARRVSPAGVRPDGYVLRLPFRDADRWTWALLAPEGELRVRMGVPGERVLQASVPVVLHPPNSFADRLERLTRSRFDRNDGGP